MIWQRNIGWFMGGTHTIVYDKEFTKRISDGMASFGPGTDNERLHDECRLIII